MKYAMKSKFGKFIWDYGLLIMFIGFGALSIKYLVTDSITAAFAATWILIGVIISYIDYKVEHLETIIMVNRDIVSSEMATEFFTIKFMLQEIKEQQQSQQKSSEDEGKGG